MSRFIQYFFDAMPCTEEPWRVRVIAICALTVVPAGFLFSTTLPWKTEDATSSHFKQPTQTITVQSTSVQSIQFPHEVIPVQSDTTTISSTGLTMTAKTTMTSQLPLIPYRLNPWVPYQLDAQGIEQVERGLNFSLGCDATCRAKMLRCNELEVPRCFDTDCHCSKGFLFPSEMQASVSTRGRIAVVLVGQTRSFFSKLMNDYWRLFLARFRGDAVLFAVLSTVSGQKGRFSGLPVKKGQVWSKFTVRELKERLDNLNVTWDAVFLDEPCSWEVARKYVKDSLLRDMLTPSKAGKLPGEGGYENWYRTQTIALDRLLRYETKTGRRFQHVVLLRPDVVSYFGNEDHVSVVSSVKDGVLWFNDMIAIFERKFATYVFTVPATLRSLHVSATNPDAYRALNRKLAKRFPSRYTALIIPHGHCAYHGIPICGRSLQVLPNISCNFPDFQVSMIGIVRNLWRVKGPQRVCLDLTRGSLKMVQDYFRRLGVQESLVQNFTRCHEDT
eukprot:s1620_g19.t1